MKTFAVAGTAVLLLASAEAHVATSQAAAPHKQQILRGALSAYRLPLLSRLTSGHRFSTNQTSATATPTGTAVASTPTPGTPAPSATATVSPYPDARPIIQQAVTVLQGIRQSHFQLITTAEQTGVEKLVIKATGQATCKNLAYQETVAASDTKAGRKPSTKKAKFIGIKTAVYENGKATKHKWVKVTPKKVSFFGFTGDQFLGSPLACPNDPSSSGSSGGSGTTSISDTNNLGPETYKGIAAWHVQFTLIDTSSTTAIPVIYDLVVSQKDSTPYVIQSTVNDTADKVVFTQKQILSSIGKKVTIKKPKLG